MSKLLKYSPQRGTNLKGNYYLKARGFRILCPTRWTVRAASLASVKDNYKARDSDTHAWIIGVQHCMITLEYLFSLVLGEHILKHTDNLSKTLENPTLSASDSQEIAELTCETLASIRSDEVFDLICENVLLQQNHIWLDDPALPRKRKIPSRLEIATGESHYPLIPKMFIVSNIFRV